MCTLSIRMLEICLFFLCFSFISKQPLRGQEILQVIPSRGITGRKTPWYSNEKIEALLKQKISLDVKNIPLNRLFEKEFPIIHRHIKLDERSLEDVGLSSDLSVSIQLKDVKLEILLNLLLSQYDLTWVESRGKILITTPEEAEAELIPRYYHVSNSLNKEWTSINSIAEIVTTTIHPESWDALGGPGPFTVIDDGFVIAQTEEIHKGVESLLMALERVKAISNEKYDVTPLPLNVPNEDDLATFKVLNHKIDSLEVDEKPLISAIQELFENTEINLFIDLHACDDSGLAADDILVSGIWDELTREEILLDMLVQFDLEYRRVENVIVITTIVENKPEIYLYPVKDFITSQTYQSSRANSNFFGSKTLEVSMGDELAETIACNIDSHTWADLGGAGSIAYFDDLPCLIVLNYREVHYKIDQLLSEIRAKRKRVPLVNPGKLEGDKIHVSSYPIVKLSSAIDQPSPIELKNEMTQLIAIIQQEVESDSWNDDQFYIKKVGDNLIIKQQARVHFEIEDFLLRLGYLQSQSFSSFGNSTKNESQKESHSSNSGNEEINNSGGYFHFHEKSQQE